MIKKIVIIGAGGFAREVLDICDACNQDKQTYEVVGFIVDQQYGLSGELVNDKPILGDFDWLEKHSDFFVTCAVGAPQHRYQLIKRAQKLGCHFFNLIHPSAILTRWISLGEGVIVTAGCILTNNILIGNHVHINLGCTVGHDVVIKDYVTLSPGVHISGNIEIGEGCYVGTGTNTIEKLNIGEWSIIGAGSTIVREVSPNTTVVGVPGKVIKTMEQDWQVNEK